MLLADCPVSGLPRLAALRGDTDFTASAMSLDINQLVGKINPGNGIY
jgi:hypothetical protein